MSDGARHGGGPTRPLHPATVVQPKTPFARSAPRPPHPATVVRPKSPPPWTAQAKARPPHPATVAQPSAPHLASPAVGNKGKGSRKAASIQRSTTLHAQQNSGPSLDLLEERMLRDAWQPEYVAGLLEHLEALRTRGLGRHIPPLLKWQEGTLLDTHGRPFGELRGHDFLNEVNAYVSECGGEPEEFLDWVGEHSGNSDNPRDRAFQYFWGKQRTLDLSDYYWPLGSADAHRMAANIDALTSASQIWHAVTIELLSCCNFPRNDRRNGTVTLYRAVSWSVIGGYKSSPFEACSLVSVASVGAGALMEYVVPHHDVWLSYFPTRMSGTSRCFFKDDGESEFLVLPRTVPHTVVSSVPSMPDKFDEATETWSVDECFISTACVRSMGLPDDCEELTVMRRFRDEYVRLLEGGELIVARYYATSPRILARIHESPQAELVLHRLYARVSRCVALAKAGDNAGALAEYLDMVTTLEQTYLETGCVSGG